MSGSLRCGRNEPADLQRRRRLIGDLRVAVEETRELPDGYALRFSGDEPRARSLLDFISFERSCCPFLRFALEFEAQQGPIWLSVRGPAGVKDFVRAEIAAAGLDPDILR